MAARLLAASAVRQQSRMRLLSQQSRSYFDFSAPSNALANLEQSIQNSFSTKATSWNQAMGASGETNGFTYPESPTQQRRSFAHQRRLRPRRFGPRPVASPSSGDIEQPPKSQIFPVSAIHIAQTIDVFPVLSTLFARDAIRKQLFQKNSAVVQLPTAQETDPPKYVAVFRFGSIVGFNLSPRELVSMVEDIKKHSTEPVLHGFERKESFGVLLQPQAVLDPEEHQPIVTGDYCVVEELDMNGVSVIAHIMAQTVALDSYNDVVDDLLAGFAKINTGVAKSGKFQRLDKEFLFKTVAQNNSIFIDMISKIRIKDRSDTAWNLSKYEEIHYGLKEEFEIDSRFDHIEFKLNLIQNNAKFFLEVLQSQKSNTLEWIIVVLIAMECVIMTADMAGVGESLMGPLMKYLDLSPPSS